MAVTFLTNEDKQELEQQIESVASQLTVMTVDYEGFITPNAMVSTSGAIYPGNGRTAVIFPCKVGETYRLDYNGAIRIGTVCFVANESKKAVSTISDNSNASTIDNSVWEFTIPDNGAYIIFHYNPNSTSFPILYKVNTNCLDELGKEVKQVQQKNEELENELNNVACEMDKSRHSKSVFNLHAAAKFGFHKGGNQNVEKRFTALVTTDVHRDGARLSNAVNFLNENSNVFDCGMCLGDIQGNNYSEGNTWYAPIVNTSLKPFYTLIGNHDTYDSKTAPYTGGTPLETYNMLLGTPGATQQPYYAVDFEEYNLVMICLNNYDAPSERGADGSFSVARSAEAFSQTQLDWFVNQLNNIPSGRHLVIVRHSFPSPNVVAENEWSQALNGLTGENIRPYDGTNKDNIIPDIINAWINGENLTISYAPKTGYELCPTLSVNADFTSRGNGNFVGYLVGHSHCDLICKSSKYPNQLVIGFCATAGGTSQNYQLDLPRVDGTRTEDAFTAVTIDTTESKIRLVRIGSDLTFDLRKREYVTVDYAPTT